MRSIHNMTYVRKRFNDAYRYIGFFMCMGPAAVSPSLADASVNAKHLTEVLSVTHVCSDTLVVRSEALSPEQNRATCKNLASVEKQFFSLFNVIGAAVKHDFNHTLRLNIYASRASFQNHAESHFNMPTNNGGMYLEGYPEREGNQAEFVAYQGQDKSIHNLAHEYVHYLDARFNLYGDFCAALHDLHAPPENCPKPAPNAPYLVWWMEGIAEYTARGDSSPTTAESLINSQLKLSDIFNTGYESNGGSMRIYTGGYYATRFMMEKHRKHIEQMLTFTRTGDYPRYQALVRSWSTSFDGEFNAWLGSIDKSIR